MTYQHDFIDSISYISEQVWDSLTSDHVFTSYAWLSALEKSGCVNKQTGWLPQHLVIKQNEHIVAILPGYIKSHSYGEYVFD
ncbi:MAG: peptidogalycan biosysnthesis protein, partial [Pseudomonadota bacterium]